MTLMRSESSDSAAEIRAISCGLMQQGSLPAVMRHHVLTLQLRCIIGKTNASD